MVGIILTNILRISLGNLPFNYSPQINIDGFIHLFTPHIIDIHSNIICKYSLSL